MVSVIIPTYNREKTICKALNSVLNQTYEDIEVIVVDDCSTDNTESVIKSIEDNRLKYIKLSKNSGACHARNVGISNSHGDFIAFEDSDDLWHADKLEKQLRVLNENNVDILACSYNQYIETYEHFKKVMPALEESGFLEPNILLRQSIIGTPTIIGRKHVFDEFQFDENLPRFQDFDLVIRISDKYQIYMMKEPLVDAFVQNDSISRSLSKMINAQSLILNNNKRILGKYPDALIYHYKRLVSYKSLSGNRCTKECIDIFKHQKTFNNFIKIILSMIGLLPLWYKKMNIEQNLD